MSGGSLAALITAVAGLCTALGTLLSQISHLSWHRQQGQAAQQAEQPDPPVAGKP